MRWRLTGIALFLPVPIVLWLLTAAPLGVARSLTLAVVLIASHRFYARPWAVRHADQRCLWCGSVAHDGVLFELQEPRGTTRWATCRTHRPPLERFFGWAARHRLCLRIGIVGTLLGFLLAAALTDLPFRGLSAAFRVGVAVTVLPLGWLAARPDGRAVPTPPVAPFPVHIQALIGTYWVSWLFRIVGLIWLAAGTVGLRSLWAR